jgi:hypothetical protein
MSAVTDILNICIRELGAQKVMEIATRSLPSSASTPPHVTTVTAAPGAPKKVKIIVKAKKADEAPAPPADPVVKNLELVLTDYEEPSSSEAPQASAAASASAVSDSSTKVKVKVKKPTTDAPTCDGRMEGEKVEMEGTKAPNGNPLHCYKPIQCDRKGTESVSVDNGEGELHLCKICIKRYNARAENPQNWHGFFDDDGAPETSHFEGGAWYKKKMAAAAAKAE